MSILNQKEETLLEQYQKSLKRKLKTTNDFSIKSRINDILDYLNEKKENIFQNEKVLVFILEQYLEEDTIHNYLDTYIRSVTKIYQAIIADNTNIDSDNLIALLQFHIISHKPSTFSIMDLELFSPLLYSKFENKNHYLQIMNAIYKNDIHRNNINIKEFTDYATKNREYFSQEDTFAAHLQSILLSNTSLTEEVYDYYTNNNKKRIGIYDIDENHLEQLDNLVNASNGILQELQTARKLCMETINTMKRVTNECMEELKETAEKETANSHKIISGMLEQDKLERNKRLAEETDKYRRDRDRILNKLDDIVQEKANKLDEETSNQLQRIRDVGNEVKKAISEISDLDSDELIKRAHEIQSIIQTVPSVITKVPEKTILVPTSVPTPTVITKKEIPQEINHFFDSRISFTSRFNELEEKKQEREEKGEIYHKDFSTLLKMIIENCNPYIWGNSGLGKTYMVKQAFDLLNQEYRTTGRILEDYDITGIVLPNGEYSNPLFYQCYKYGYGAFLDELDSGISSAILTINQFTSKEKNSCHSFPNGEIIYRHPNFRIVAAGNTAGTGSDIFFTDRTQLDESILQRLIPLELAPDARIEERILKDYPDWFEFTQNFRKATNKYAKERNLKAAPGEITTRDTEEIKQFKNDKVFTDEEIIKYKVIQNKDTDYLSFLVNAMEEISPDKKQKCKSLHNTFKTMASEIIEE